MQREQVSLFSPTLDAMIAEDHPVRLFDELLSTCDWSAWENHYCLAVSSARRHSPRYSSSTASLAAPACVVSAAVEA
jgi:transposase